jgi:hypothetical protein
VRTLRPRRGLLSQRRRFDPSNLLELELLHVRRIALLPPPMVVRVRPIWDIVRHLKQRLQRRLRICR